MTMPATLRGYGRHLLYGCDPVLGRGHAREGAEVAVEVRLVVVATVERDVDQVRADSQPLERPLEAQQPRERLRRHAQLAVDGRREMPAAPADLVRQLADGDRVVQALPGP